MSGRNPHEPHRSATNLELLFDLAFVVAFGQAGEQLAHLVAEGQVAAGLAAFGFSMFAICWAWINFSWFASAYDTDDWFYRVTTMVQMIGVIVLALGIEPVFHSLAEGHGLDNTVLVAGYVIMRVAMVAQWLRAARDDPLRREVALRYAAAIVLAQIGWIALTLLHLDLGLFVAGSCVLYLIELAGPILAERRGPLLEPGHPSAGTTPWNHHHIAERYGLLTIIALGEGVIGTIASVAAVVETQGWSFAAVTLVIAGIGLTFGMWWSYFTLPSAKILHRFRSRAWIWGYGHIFVFASVAATGAGLHTIAYVVEGESEISEVAAVLAVALPVAVFMASLYGLHFYLLRRLDNYYLGVFAVSIAVLVASLILAAVGVSLAVCLIMVTLAPTATVVGYETLGRVRAADSLEQALA